MEGGEDSNSLRGCTACLQVNMVIQPGGPTLINDFRLLTLKR